MATSMDTKKVEASKAADTKAAEAKAAEAKQIEKYRRAAEDKSIPSDVREQMWQKATDLAAKAAGFAKGGMVLKKPMKAVVKAPMKTPIKSIVKKAPAKVMKKKK
jgi:hypothetical protein